MELRVEGPPPPPPNARVGGGRRVSRQKTLPTCDGKRTCLCGVAAPLPNVNWVPSSTVLPRMYALRMEMLAGCAVFHINVGRCECAR